MNNLNKITKILGATFVLVSSTNALAAETATATATVTVLNAFTFTADTTLDFGTLRATSAAVASGAGDNIATLVMSANPAAPAAIGTTVNAAAITVLTAGTPANFSVSGVAPFAALTITLPIVESVMTGAALPGTSSNFTVNTFTAFITSGGNTGTAYATAGDLQATNAGAVTFSVGATLSTDDAGAAITQQYQDSLAYTGTFDVIVDY